MLLDEFLLSELSEAKLFQFLSDCTIERQLSRVHICFNCYKPKFEIKVASQTYFGFISLINSKAVPRVYFAFIFVFIPVRTTALFWGLFFLLLFGFTL